MADNCEHILIFVLFLWTLWGQVIHICICKLESSLIQIMACHHHLKQIWLHVNFGHLTRYFTEIWIIIQQFLYKKWNSICFLAATKQLYEWYFLSVCPSVTPFWLCSHHRIIMKFSGVITLDQGKVHAKGQGQRSKVKVTEVTTQIFVSGL